jgi:hypothetical protein
MGGAFNDPPGKHAEEVLLDDVGLVIFDASPARSRRPGGMSSRNATPRVKHAAIAGRVLSGNRLHEPRPN